jgi:hypothetical protein
MTRRPWEWAKKDGPAGGTSSGAGLAKAAADPDSLRVTAEGYAPKAIALTALDAAVDITLDSLATSGPGMKNPPGPSSGYDKNYPYPLIFAFHWNGGTMGDVDGGGTSGYICHRLRGPFPGPDRRIHQ